MATAEGWDVVLLWDQGPYAFGTRLTELVSLVDEAPVTVESLALDVSLLLFDEPHGPQGQRDATGRYWLG